MDALLRFLRRSCGHACLDARVLRQGYHFYAAISDELPQFFNRRISTGSSTVSITLQAGLTGDGKEPFAECRNTAEAADILDGSDLAPTFWFVTVTVDGMTVPLSEVTSSAFIASHPNEFRVIAEELVAVGMVDDKRCGLCRESEQGSDLMDAA